MKEKFDLKEFAEGNNVTYIHLNDGDFVYIQIPKPEDTGDEELRKIRVNADNFFEWAFKDMGVKHSADFIPLKITVLTKKEEFVARIGDDIVQI